VGSISSGSINGWLPAARFALWPGRAYSGAVTRLFWLALMFALALPATAGAAGDEPLETLVVPPNSKVRGKEKLDAGVRYKLSISGSMTLTQGQSVHLYDALFCYGEGFFCRTPERTKGHPVLRI